MQPTRRTLLAAAATIAGGPLGIARAEVPVRAVVELFTSQGCSSCPPADRLLGELARDPTLVVLSLPVDYWDRLGWKDSFARPEFTSRQRAYAAARGDGEIYTPQAVVNGQAIAVGSDRGGILSLAGHGLPVGVTIGREADGLLATVQGAPPGAILIAAPFLRARTVAIGRGENANARVTYTNIVQRLIPLGAATGPVRLDARSDQDAGVAVLVQEGGLDTPGRILGAAIL
jgi:hypothetical protein